MAILITEKTRVIVQGMSGRIGSFHAVFYHISGVKAADAP